MKPKQDSQPDISSKLESPPAYHQAQEDVVPTSSSLPRIATPSEDAEVERIDQIIPINDDGRIDLHIEALSNLYRHFRDGIPAEKVQTVEELSPPAFQPPKMNILMLVVGSRGDVQPFVALAQALNDEGHRVRLATHPHFRSFVETHDVEFFSIGGDPTELMAYMVQNPGLMPKFAALRKGEIQKRRRSMREMIHASWRACFESGSIPSGNNFRIQIEKAVKPQPKTKDPKPFVADAILANPPSLAHIHCAEKLGIPLHIMFTMPWLPTQGFPHPLANVKPSQKNVAQMNYLSYLFVESIIWQGLGSILNRFRYRILELDPIHPSRAPAILPIMRIPHTFCWSSSLLQKPLDWHSRVAVSGYIFQNDQASYAPPLELRRFLEAGPPPIYIGFGSIVVEDPASLTNIVIEAVKRTGHRAIISAGWSSLCQPTGQALPSDIFVLREDCPHDWLFPRVSCVVHHGGAGTTAAGLRAGRPTVIVPFFGDQFFWGDIVYKAGASPRPISYRSISAVTLGDAIYAAIQPEVLTCAARLGEEIMAENGLEGALQHIYAHLPTEVMTCALSPSNVAVWKSKSTGIRMSAVAATVLRKEKLLEWKDLVLHRSIEHDVAKGPFEPVSGMLWAVTELFYESFRGMGEILTEVGHVPVVGHRWLKKAKSSVQKVDDSDEEVLNYRLTVMEKISVEYPMPNVSVEKNHAFLGKFMLTGAARIGKAAVRAPGNFTSAMAQGAHNMPRMWGDSMVRPATKVTGVGSGLFEGGKELVLGVYDGISGLFTQPVYGFIEEGPVGFVKGAGKGVLGLPLKFFAAASGIAGYPLKGIDVAVSHALNSDGMKAVREQRMLQGEYEYVEASDQSKADILQRWSELTEKKGSHQVILGSRCALRVGFGPFSFDLRVFKVGSRIGRLSRSEALSGLVGVGVGIVKH